MSSGKGKKAGGAANAKAKKAPRPGVGVEKEGNEPLQAVVIADSFQTRFKPLTVDTPRCLLPLANVPLIEYTLEFLAYNGVQDVFIYPGNHTDKVERYLAQSKWAISSGRSPFNNLNFIRMADATSIGDVLRDLDKRNVIPGDFILVHGDVVLNLDLESVLVSHKERRKASADNIMTMVLMEAGAKSHKLKAKGITPAFVIDTKTHRCLQYDEMHPLQSERYLEIDPTVFKLSTDFQLRTDLVDPGIDICTPEALALWSDSIDYSLPRRNFVNGVLKDWELNGKMIHAELLKKGYAARANNLAMYESVSKDVLLRWPYPFVPDTNIFPEQEYRMNDIGVYVEEQAVVGRKCELRQAMVGNGSFLNTGCIITESTIGRDCIIGKNVTISDSFIWPGTTIGDNTTISRSILAGRDMKIGSGCTIEPGCVLSFGVVVDDDVTVPGSSLISRTDDSGAPLPNDNKLLGPAGQGAFFVDPELEELDERDPSRLQRNIIYSLENFHISTPSVSDFGSESGSDDDDLPASPGTHTSSRSRVSSFASDGSGSHNFVSEGAAGLLEALRNNNIAFESAKMEFQGLRFSSNASGSAIRKAVAVAFGRFAAQLLEEGLTPNKAAEEALNRSVGASRFIGEVTDGSAEEADFALGLQRTLAGSKNLDASRAGLLLSAMLQQMYALEVIEEDGIMTWWDDDLARAESTESPRASAEAMEGVRAKCKALVDWLLEASSDSEDSEDSEDGLEDGGK